MRMDRCFVGAAMLVSAACTSTNAPTATTALPPVTVPSAPAPLPTVSGIVSEGSRPISGVTIDNGYGPGSWVFTDADGAFQLPATISVEPHDFIRASKTGYAQPCAAPITAGAPVNVQLVSLGALGSATLRSAAGYRTIAGVVLMTTSSGPQPVAGAWVDFEPAIEPLDDWPAAYTTTDANGKFSLCMLPVSVVTIDAVFSGTFAAAKVPAGQTSIEMTLQPIRVNGNPR